MAEEVALFPSMPAPPLALLRCRWRHPHRARAAPPWNLPVLVRASGGTHGDTIFGENDTSARLASELLAQVAPSRSISLGTSFPRLNTIGSDRHTRGGGGGSREQNWEGWGVAPPAARARSARSAQLGDDEGDHAARSASRGQEPTPSPLSTRVEDRDESL